VLSLLDAVCLVLLVRKLCVFSLFVRICYEFRLLVRGWLVFSLLVRCCGLVCLMARVEFVRWCVFSFVI